MSTIMRQHASHSRIDTHSLRCEQVLRIVASYFELRLIDMLSTSRNKQNIAFARQVAMYLANTHYAVPMSVIGRVFGRDRTTVSFGCRKIEDHRDNPSIDTILCCLELMLANSDHQITHFSDTQGTNFSAGEAYA